MEEFGSISIWVVINEKDDDNENEEEEESGFNHSGMGKLGNFRKFLGIFENFAEYGRISSP